ncbi:hypothetical protein VKT23_001660 [Stygiomarasmius scandens]|uniref:Derlin n=1 Tax=Marasmiellus scandens TaxID=2682957 RepID=A0ABR1K1M9_9AGAR
MSSNALARRNLVYAGFGTLFILQAILLYLAPPSHTFHMDIYGFWLPILSQANPILMVYLAFAVIKPCEDVISLHPSILPLLFLDFYFGMSVMVIQFGRGGCDLPAFLLALFQIPLWTICDSTFTHILRVGGMKQQEIAYLRSFHNSTIYYFGRSEDDEDDEDLEVVLPDFGEDFEVAVAIAEQAIEDGVELKKEEGRRR